MSTSPPSPPAVKLNIISNLIHAHAWVIGMVDPNGNILTNIMVPSEAALDKVLEVMQERLKIMRKKLKEDRLEPPSH